MKHGQPTKQIEQRVLLHASPKRVFAALMDSDKHAEFTGKPASIEPRPGGSFACYGTYITGITLERIRVANPSGQAKPCPANMGA